MRTDFIVMAPLGLNDNLCLTAGPDPLEVQALVPELAIEALASSVLPGLAGIDQGCLDALVDHPLENGAGYELRTIAHSELG